MELDKNRGQLVSHEVIRADLGVFGRELVVISGIAQLDWRIDDSDSKHDEQCTVRLRERVDNIENVTVHVGLASIANDDTEFVFAVDAASVRVDEAGELVLDAQLALLGDWSVLARFSYQVVAVTRRVDAQISGTITWDIDQFVPATLDPAGVSGVFTIVAHQREVQHIKGKPGEFDRTVETLTPVTPGEVVSVTSDGSTVQARYRITEPPKGVPLKVIVRQRGLRTPAGHQTVVVNPTRPNGDLVELTVAEPRRSDVDFRTAVQGVR